MKFSEKLIKLRKDNKLSQEQLASMLDVSRQSVSKWESGQTYPEMDKLLSLCKIFKCSLDDLTNDEISRDDITNNSKKKYTFIGVMYEMLEFINKSISMFKAMSFKEITKMFFELFLFAIFLIFVHIPFGYVIKLGQKIFHHFDISYSLSSGLIFIWSNLINIIYFIIFLIIFIYIYKVRYVDKFVDTDDIIIKKEKIDGDSGNNNDKHTERVSIKEKKIKKDHSFVLFNILGTFVLWIIKFIIILVAIPFVIALVVIPILLIIDILLLFKKVIFIGILLGLIAALTFVIMVVEVIFRFIFNMRINLQKTLWMFLGSIMSFGVAIGIFIVEVSGIEYIDELPIKIKMDVKEQEFTMDDKIFFDTDWHEIYDYYEYKYFNLGLKEEIKYVEDSTLKDKVRVKLEYYGRYTEMYTESIDLDDECIRIHSHSAYDFNDLISIMNIVIDGLSKKQIYNFDKLDEHKITITTSKENIAKLSNNSKKYFDKKNKEYQEQQRENENNVEKELREQIDSLKDSIIELENKNKSCERENYDLNDKVLELEQKIQEYKTKISELLDE